MTEENPITLQLTYKDLREIMREDHEERFKVIFDDIPYNHEDYVRTKGETHRSFVEDDGREMRWFIFKDLVTDIEYYFNYTYHRDWSVDLPSDMFDAPKGIEFVEKSVLFPEPEPAPIKEPILTPLHKAVRDLNSKYKAIEPECKILAPKEKLQVPSKKIKEVLAFLKRKDWSSYDLQMLLTPICIEYKIDRDSFWQWLQVKRGAWKCKK